MTVPKIGSLYVCDTAEPHGFVTYEVWNDNGQWQKKYEQKRSSHSLLKTLICNVPLLVIDLPGTEVISDELNLSLYGSPAYADWVVCLYEETLVIMPKMYFTRPLSDYTNTFYREC